MAKSRLICWDAARWSIWNTDYIIRNDRYDWHARQCKTMQDDARWCKTRGDDAKQCKTREDDIKWCKIRGDDVR